MLLEACGGCRPSDIVVLVCQFPDVLICDHLRGGAACVKHAIQLVLTGSSSLVV